MNDLAVVILTYNEEIHIERCLENVSQFAKEIFIIDSFSTDRTIEIAEKFNVKILQNKWENNYSKQFNWGLVNAPISCEWVLRLDADEYLSDELIVEIKSKLHSLPAKYTGVEFPRNHIFINKEIKNGGNDVVLLRLFKYKIGFCEERLMDEHIQLKSGECIKFNNYFYDHNLHDLTWWSKKHVGYAIREAIDMLDIKYDLLGNAIEDKYRLLNDTAKNKRNLKHRYAHMKKFWRAFFYFIYRLFIKGGYKDGKEGFIWCFLQAFWYRMLVDSLIFQIEKETNRDKNLMLEYLKKKYSISLR